MSDDGYGSGPHPDWLDVDWSEALQWIMVDGRPVNVLDVGPRDAEQTLLFIHGHSACWQHWLEQLPRFMDEHRCIALDLPGFGRSPMPADGVSMTDYAHDVEKVCEALDAGPVTVVGNSMGGFVGAELAIRHPDRVERLVLVAAAGMSGKYIGLPTALITHPTGVVLGRVLLGLTGVPDSHARRLARTPRGRQFALGIVCRYPRRLHPALVYELAKGAGRPAGAPAAVALASYDFKDRVSEIECPTLIIWGDTDRLVPIDSAEAYCGAIADATMTIYEQTGHVPMLERPGRFNDDLAAFLRDESVGERPERLVGAAA